jgi:hypothetical protein
MVAILLKDFDTMTITKMVNGKEIKEVVPRYKAGRRYETVEMNFFWMSPEEKGGIGVDIGTMDYLRLTYPGGSKTQYYDLFELKNV